MSAEHTGTGYDKADLARLRREKLKLSRRYALVLMIPYFAFIAAIALVPEALALPLDGEGRLTLGLAVSFILIVATIFLTGGYLRHSERTIDPLQQKVHRGAGR